MGDHTITSGLEGAWTPTPVTWDMTYFDMLLDHEYELVRSPAGAVQWQPVGNPAETLAPGAHSPDRRVPTMMSTADMALKVDPGYRAIMEKFRADPPYFADAFARAWFKLCHRDMGPKARYLGPEVPAEDLIWQDPIPAAAGAPIDAADVNALKGKIAASGLTIAELVSTAWASASTYRASDHRGGPTARASASRRKRIGTSTSPSSWAASWPSTSGSRRSSTARPRAASTVSIADLIVMGGDFGVETAAQAAGHAVQVPFAPGRTDALPEQTDAESFAVLEPKCDGFRNYLQVRFSVPTEELLIDRAQLLPAQRGGDDGAGGRPAHAGRQPRQGQEPRRLHRPPRPADQRLLRQPARHGDGVEGSGRPGRRGVPGHGPRIPVKRGGPRSRTDLVFGSNSQLRAVSEVYASADAGETFVQDFVAAWSKVMNADRFDLAA